MRDRAPPRRIEDTTRAEKPRVLFVTRTAEWTGPTNSLLQLVTQLRDRFEPCVILPGTGELTDRLEKVGVPFVSLASLRKSELPTLARLMRRGDFDLVYANETSSGAKNALIAAKLLRLPFVYHVRAMCQNGSWRKVGFLRFADTVIAVSRATADSLRPYVRVAPEVVYNGVPRARERPERAAARTRLRALASLPRTSFVLVAVGTVHSRKGQEYAIRALRKVVDLHPSAHLVLAGRLTRDPEYVESMRRLTRQLGMEGRVRFLGLRDDIWEILHGADLFVHPAVEDPHPRAVIEAMAAGLPVVASDVDGISETVDDGRTGLLVPPRDSRALAEAVGKLCADASLRDELARNARGEADARFTAEETGRRIAEILEATLRRTRGRSYTPVGEATPSTGS